MFRQPIIRRRFSIITPSFLSTSVAAVTDCPQYDTISRILTHLNPPTPYHSAKQLFNSLKNDYWFKNEVFKLGPSEIDTIIEKLSPDSAIEFFFLLQNEFGIKHLIGTKFVIAHILAEKKESRALWCHLQRVLQEEGSGSAPSLCELLSRSFIRWDSNHMVWDMLALVYSQSGMIHDALFVLSRMKDLSIEPSIMTYNSLLHNLRGTDIMWDIYGEIVTNWTRPIEYKNSIFRQSLIHEAIAFMCELQEKDCEPCVVWFNLLMSGFCRKGSVDIAKSFFCKMFKYGLIPDVYSYKEMRMKRIVPNSLQHISRLLRLCEKKTLSEARSYFDTLCNSGLIEDVVLYNIMIDKYIKHGNIAEAVDIFDKLLEKRISPTIVTFNSLINGLCKYGKLADARKWLIDIKMHNLLPTVVTYTTLMNAFCEVGDLESTFELLDDMDSNGVEPNHITYTVIMKGLCKKGMLEESIRVIEDMITKGLFPDQTAYNALIQCFCKSRDLKRAFQLHDEMIRLNIQPNTVTYNTLINGLCVYGDISHAERVFSFLQDVKNVKLSKIAYTTLIKAHCAKGDSRKAMVLFRQMAENGFEISVKDYSAVINRLCKRSLPYDAIGFFRMMLIDGIAPDPQICFAMIHSFGQVNHFSAKIQFYGLMIKCGFDPD